MSSSSESVFHPVQETLADYLEFTFQNATMSMPRDKWLALEDNGYYGTGNDVVSMKVSFPTVANEKDAADEDTPRFENPAVYFYGGDTGTGGSSITFHWEIIDYFQKPRKLFLVPDPSLSGNLLLETHSQIPFRWLSILKEYNDEFADAVITMKEIPSLRETIRSVPMITLMMIITSLSKSMRAGATIDIDDVTIGESGEKWATRNITDYEEVTREKRNRQTWAIEKYTQKQYRQGSLSKTALDILEKSSSYRETKGNIVIRNEHTEYWKKFVEAYRKETAGDDNDGTSQISTCTSTEPTAIGYYSDDYFERQEQIEKKILNPTTDPDTFGYYCSPEIMGEELFILKLFLRKNGVKCHIPRLYLS